MIIYIIYNRLIDGSIYLYINRLNMLVINRIWNPSHHHDVMNFENIAAPANIIANLYHTESQFSSLDREFLSHR